ncbi:MAG: hypothetical protein DI534_14180 [Leifsonia xyli]|nr:MAG: hypothetical protein DI534_14180 [Leifsonia xyli]
MAHEKDHRAGRTYVEPQELSARERGRDARRRTQADAASGDQQEPDADALSGGAARTAPGDPR